MTNETELLPEFIKEYKGLIDVVDTFQREKNLILRLLDRILALQGENQELKNTRHQPEVSEKWEDNNDKYSDDIAEVHPATCENPDHETYEKAVQMVSNRHSKYELVDLVNWLLVKDKPEVTEEMIEAGAEELFAQDPFGQIAIWENLSTVQRSRYRILFKAALAVKEK